MGRRPSNRSSSVHAHPGHLRAPRGATASGRAAVCARASGGRLGDSGSRDVRKKHAPTSTPCSTTIPEALWSDLQGRRACCAPTRRRRAVGWWRMPEQRVALVTGAARGIGAAIAARLAHDGACVAVCDVDEAAATEHAKRIGRAFALRLDVTDPESARQAVEAVLEREGRLDVLVNNAGIAGMSAPVAEYPAGRVAAHPVHRPGRRLLLLQGSAAAHARTRQRTDRQYRVDLGQGRQSEHVRVFVGQSRRDRLHQVARPRRSPRAASTSTASRRP